MFPEMKIYITRRVPAQTDIFITRGSHFCFAVEARCPIPHDSPKSFKILRIEMENYRIIMAMGMY
jgi:hypothetical protein